MPSGGQFHLPIIYIFASLVDYLIVYRKEKFRDYFFTLSHDNAKNRIKYLLFFIIYFSITIIPVAIQLSIKLNN